jgi:hypothetical protein
MGFLVLDADVVLDHQLCKLAPVDQHHPGGNTLSVCGSICGEAAGRDEDATVRLGAVKGSDERLDPRPPNRMLRPVTLCLNIDAIEAECILADNPVQALIASPPQVLRRPAVPP